ncbi:MAG TPA: DinB family protein [Gemmatimonadales bacterium]|nr:DinB family protein [Gemmatimonadales bacterium]
MPMRDALLPEFDAETASTRRLLERFPDGQAAWKPHPKSMSLGRLASHIAEIPGYTLAILQSLEFDIEGGRTPQSLESRDAILALFDEQVARAREPLSRIEDSEMMVEWTFRKGSHIIMRVPRASALRILVLSHMIHHRGQLTVYLRLHDIPLPATYGTSADEGGA